MRIGKVSRLHGYKGELSLKLDREFQALFSELDFVYLKIDKKPVPYFIDSVRYTPKGFALVFFEGIEGQQAAESVRGKEVWIDQEKIPEEIDEELSRSALNEYMVIDDEQGEIGPVATVVEHPGNSFLIIDKEDGEVYIPLQEEIIQEIDHDKRVILINAPDGLIELNLD